MLIFIIMKGLVKKYSSSYLILISLLLNKILLYKEGGSVCFNDFTCLSTEPFACELGKIISN